MRTPKRALQLAPITEVQQRAKQRRVAQAAGLLNEFSRRLEQLAGVCDEVGEPSVDAEVVLEALAQGCLDHPTVKNLRGTRGVRVFSEQAARDSAHSSVWGALRMTFADKTLPQPLRVQLASVLAPSLMQVEAGELGINPYTWGRAQKHWREYGPMAPVLANRRVEADRAKPERIEKLQEWIGWSALLQVLPYVHHTAVYHRNGSTAQLYADYLRYVTDPTLRFSESYILKTLRNGAFSAHKSKTCVCASGQKSVSHLLFGTHLHFGVG